MAEGSKKDRELIELLNELRVALPGVQVLFAFLLTVPFTQRFTSLNQSERNAFFLAFICTALASIFLMAPTAYHRIQWRERDKEHMLRVSNGQAIAGMIFLAIAMASVVWLITEVLFGNAWGALVTAAVAALFVWFWFGLPLKRHLTGAHDS
jgi:cobalamin synthase